MVKQWFTWVVDNPRTVVCACILSMFVFGIFVPRLYKDTSPDAYIEPTNPALIYRDKVKEIFGLDDPFVIAVEAPEGETIYSIEALGLIAELTELMMATSNIEPDRVVSLTTEKIISGTADRIDISTAYDEPPSSQTEVDVIQQRVEAFPVFLGNLVARDGTMAMIVGEMVDQSKSHQTFLDLSTAIDSVRGQYVGTVHLAGEASTAGYLDSYISQDARRSYPLAAAMIILVLSVAFRSVAGVLLPLSIAVATAIAAMGIRAYFEVPFYAISNGLVVVLISIAVADGIHIINEYRNELWSGRHATARDALLAALVSITRPVALTTITTIAGFVGIVFGSEMPPMKAFGLYSAIGVLAAWFYTIALLPAVLTLIHRNKPIASIWPQKQDRGRDLLSAFLAALAEIVVRYPKHAMTLSFVFLAVCVYGTTLVVVDYDRIDNFARNEPVRIADQVINRSMDGSYRLLVVVDAKRPQGIFNPDIVKRIEALQEYVVTLPHVNGVSSIVDTLKEVNQSVSGGDPNEKRIPDRESSIAQLFLAYESVGDPADLEDDIDFDQQIALINVRTDAGSFVKTKPIIENLEAYLASTFNAPHVQGSLSGRVYLNYHWLKSIEANHLVSVLIAVVLALTIATAAFRSFTAGFFCLFHVIFAVFMVYAVMAMFGIGLGVTTSMFAAITIGLGVDFSVHSIERVRKLSSYEGVVSAKSIRDAFQSTGRALWFNMWALCLGFSALLASNNPTVSEFGGLLIVAISANFLASMTALPAVLLVLKPKFLLGEVPVERRGAARTDGNTGTVLALLCAAGLAAFLMPVNVAIADAVDAEAEAPDIEPPAVSSPAALEVVRNTDARDHGEHLLRDLKMILTDKRGRERVRDAKGIRLDAQDERRALIVYSGPANIKDTAFLTYDYIDPEREDQQWLYLPSLRRSRQVSGAERGEYFLGTDLTFEDLKQEGRISEEDYVFDFTAEADPTPGVAAINGWPKNAVIAKELGYGLVQSRIDTSNWTILSHKIFDTTGQILKTLRYEEFVQVDGIWTASIIDVDNHKTGHKTRFEFSNIDFQTDVPETRLDQRNLKRAGK